jgi:hypothetical protein
MAQDFIVDQETSKNVAFIRGGGVFRGDKDEAKIAIVLNAYLYGLNGVLVGRLEGQHVIDASARTMPVAFRTLLEGNSCAPSASSPTAIVAPAPAM